MPWTESQNQDVTLHPCFFALRPSSFLEDFSGVSLELRPAGTSFCASQGVKIKAGSTNFPPSCWHHWHYLLSPLAPVMDILALGSALVTEHVSSFSGAALNYKAAKLDSESRVLLRVGEIICLLCLDLLPVSRGFCKILSTFVP